MEQRFLIVKSQLEELGYNQELHLDSLPLVEKLVGDLLQTTESLQKYMQLCQEIVTERDKLLLGAEPFKCDNAKLVKECNELHLAFLQYREQNEKVQKDLRRHICELERDKTNSDKDHEALKSQVKLLEAEGSGRSNRQIKSGTAKAATKPLKSSSTSALLKTKSTPRETSPAMTMAENKISNLSKEISRLKEDKLELAQANIAYKNQINSRDKEIQRLTQMLRGGRPLEALNQDCCYKDIDVKLAKLQDEVTNLKRTNSELESKLKDAISKQHEAMKRALTLAERNKILEKELKDIDRMALAVEHECNSTVKTNTEKVNRLQNRLHEAILQIQQLEKEAIDLKRDKHELLSHLEAVKTEKRHLERMLEAALEEKKRSSSRVAQYGIIENDLNLEIDRLVQLNAEQKRKIVELECKLLSGKLDKNTLKKVDEDHQASRTSAPKSKRCFSPPKFRGKPPVRGRHRMSSGGDNISVGTKAPENSPIIITTLTGKKNVEDAATSPISTLCSQPDECIKKIEEMIMKAIQEKKVCFDHLKEVVGKEVNELYTKANTSLEQFKEERDFYKNECNTLMDKLKTMCAKTDNSDLLQKLNQKEQELSKLQYELRSLTQEKQNLLIRLDSARSQPDDYDGFSHRSSTKRLERERDLLKADIQHLEEERDGLRRRINMLCENYNQEKARLESMLREREHDVRQLEQDRREIMHTQGSRRATINNLQEESDMLSAQLKSCQSELTQQRAMYTQLKMLHEQTDRALADCQSQLIQAEKELYMLQEKVKAMETQKMDSNKEVVNLKNDLKVMKNNLMTFDREKDSLLHTLDEKTEKLVLLEQELKTKDKKIDSLEANISDLRKRINDNLTERSSKEYQLRSATADCQKLQQDLESATRARELAFEENRRLQDDLTSCIKDHKKTQTDLDISRRQVDDLKRQLQHYVAEIKRAEDLISQKEVERSEMLDHYKSLSEEATNLESTNHTLENEATQARVQLSVALDHAADLERKVEVQDTMTRDYEKQISNLTAQIARLESKVAQCNANKERVEMELISMRDLCLKLDKQKDNLMKQLNENDSAKTEVTRENANLRRNSQTLQSELEKERATMENLEKHLAQCRQETVEMRLMNEELRAEAQRLKITIQELQTKLISTTEQLDLYQEKALDYSNQNKQLRREVANERFYRTREDDKNVASAPQRKWKAPLANQLKPSQHQDQERTQGDQNKNSSAKLTQISSEQELLDKCFQFPSSLATSKYSSRTSPRKVLLNIGTRAVAGNGAQILSINSISDVNIDEEFDKELSRSVKYASDINVISPITVREKPNIATKSIQDNTGGSKRVFPDLTIHKITDDDIQSGIPGVDSISDANIDQEFDDELSKSVVYPSDINIMSAYNATENTKMDNISKPNQSRPADNNTKETQRIYSNLPVPKIYISDSTSAAQEVRYGEDKAKSKIPVLERKARNSNNTTNDKENVGYRNVTCTYTSPSSSDYQTTYLFSYKPTMQS